MGKHSHENFDNSFFFKFLYIDPIVLLFISLVEYTQEKQNRTKVTFYNSYTPN